MKTIQIKTTKDFAMAVREARRLEGLTQQELALSVGSGERFIVNLEAGKETVRLGKALGVARALGIRIDIIYEQ